MYIYLYNIYTMHRSLNIRTQHFSRWWCIFRVLLLNNQFRLTIRKQIEEAIRFCYVFTNHQMKWQAFPLQTSNSADCIVTWIWQYLSLDLNCYKQSTNEFIFAQMTCHIGFGKIWILHNMQNLKYISHLV